MRRMRFVAAVTAAFVGIGVLLAPPATAETRSALSLLRSLTASPPEELRLTHSFRLTIYFMYFK